MRKRRGMNWDGSYPDNFPNNPYADRCYDPPSARAPLRETPLPKPVPATPPRQLNLAPLDRGVRLVRHLNTRYDEDPALPFKVEISLRAPEFMAVAFVCIYGGSEDIVAQAADLASLCAFVVRNDLVTHSRFRWLCATGPEGFKVEFTDRHLMQHRRGG